MGALSPATAKGIGMAIMPAHMPHRRVNQRMVSFSDAAPHCFRVGMEGFMGTCKSFGCPRWIYTLP
jgi:hypothetical protein